MSESLTDGFLESEINDHNPESSIDRILNEARIESDKFPNYLKAAFKDASDDVLDKLSTVINEVAGEGLEQQLAKVLPLLRGSLFPRLSDLLFVLKLDIEELPDRYRDAAKALYDKKNDASSLSDPLWQMLIPSKKAEQIATYVWPDDPIRFAEFAKKYLKLHESKWNVVFEAYGASPYEVLFDHLESKGLEGSLNAEPWIWNSWCLIDDDKQSYESYKERLIVSVEWHKRLVNLSLMPMAQRFEKTCPRPRGVNHDGFMFHREQVQQMEWERLSRTVSLQTDEDKKRCIELAFLTGNSFMQPDCRPEVVEQLINVSAEVNCWGEHLQDLESETLHSECFFTDIRLHELWYASDHRARWVDILDKHLDESEVSRQLLILDHLLKSQSWGIDSSEEYPVRGYAEWKKTKPRVDVEERHWNAWHKRLMAIGETFRKGEARLSYEDLILWIRIVIDHGSRSGVKRKELVPYADKALAFLRPHLNEPPEDFKVESCEMAYRILLTYAPDKLIRNLLPAIIKADQPCCGEKLEYGAGSGLHVASRSDNPMLWWFSVMISNALRVSLAWKKRSEYIREDDVRITFATEEIEEANLNLRRAFAELCSKNLALKKGKSCKEGRYSNADCVEERPIWRQAFTQALSEIGLDLGGDVHKRLNFIKKSDPDENVRKAASEAYKSVRRQKHQNEDDPVKGMLIAFWWLRLAQRKSLELDVDSSGATKTRRNELRYASQVREVVYEIQEISTQFL